MCKSPTQRGSALLTALFIITLVAIVATAMTARLRIDINRTEIIDTTDRLQLAAQAVTLWAMDRLADPKQSMQSTTASGKVLTMPKKLQHLIPNIILTGELFDLQARFNINNLSDTDYQPIFFGLLSELNIGAASFERKDLLDAVINWIQPVKSSASHDEWYDRYARQNPPYFPSHFLMSNLSELRLVYGVSSKYYQQLEPYVITLPETTAININTASKPLLMSLGVDIKKDDINHIINERAQKPYADFTTLTPFLEKYHIQTTTLTIESQYFLVITTAATADIVIHTFTILKRTKDKTGLWHMSILSQSINTL